MTTDRFVLQTRTAPLVDRVVRWGVLLFGIFFLAGPALETGSQALVATLLGIQTFAIWSASPLLRELLAAAPRLRIDEHELAFRHFGDDWLRRVPWSRVVRWEVLPDHLLVELRETADEDGGVEVVDLAYADIASDKVRAAFETALAIPANVVPLRRAA